MSRTFRGHKWVLRLRFAAQSFAQHDVLYGANPIQCYEDYVVLFKSLCLTKKKLRIE